MMDFKLGLTYGVRTLSFVICRNLNGMWIDPYGAEHVYNRGMHFKFLETVRLTGLGKQAIWFAAERPVHTHESEYLG